MSYHKNLKCANLEWIGVHPETLTGGDVDTLIRLSLRDRKMLIKTCASHLKETSMTRKIKQMLLHGYKAEISGVFVRTDLREFL
jgi:hypothetical protein